MEKLGIEKQGFHGFRRFRVTHLESNNVPHALVKYWTGHAQRGYYLVACRGEFVSTRLGEKIRPK